MSTARKCIWRMPEEGSGTGGAPAGSSSLIGRILLRRGIERPEDVREFLTERPTRTYDPFLLDDMQAAVDRVIRALDSDEKICIYGDYDADGVTSVSLLLTVLCRLTKNLTYYIPSRFEEGYGLNEKAVRQIAEDGTNLMITVDCGSLSWREVETARELGMEVIVTDHHSIGGDRVADCLMINPKKADSSYPFSELAGCGVAFKLAQALQRKLAELGDTRLLRSDVTDTLDLVAVATIGDIVALRDENRTLVKYGLNVLNQGKRAGMRELISGVGLTLGEVTSEQVAYVIVPHLNAAGRMNSASECVELLWEGEEKQTAERRRELVEFLAANNRERKRAQEETLRECRRIAEEECSGQLFKIIYAPKAHEGIAGIVAGKLKDEYYRPVVIVTPCGEGLLKGTGRSVPNVDLHGLLSLHSSLFQRFGGHKGACGFLMEEKNLDSLRRGLNERMEQMAVDDPEILTQFLEADAVAEPREITEELVSGLARLEPFGQQNSKPLFVMEQVEVRRLTFMGHEKQHVRFFAFCGGSSENGESSGGRLFSEREEQAGIDCVLFSRAEEYQALLQEGRRVDVAGYPGINTWNGVSKIQFVIEDIK